MNKLTDVELLRDLVAAAVDQGMSKSALARAAKVTQSQVSRFANGVTTAPDAEFLFKMRAYFLRHPPKDYTVPWMLDNLPVRSEDSDVLYNAALTKQTIKHTVPLISWVNAGGFMHSPDTFHPGDAEEWLPCPTMCGPSTFALRIDGPSMEPEYNAGEIIFVDPDEPWESGSDVVVRSPEGEHTFKRVVKNGSGWMLMALNPSWPDRIIPMPEGTVVCGAVIASFKDRRR